jgi:hypothetical protein
VNKRKKHSARCPINHKLRCYRSKCFPACPELQKAHQMVLDGVCLDEALRIVKKAKKHDTGRNSR